MIITCFQANQESFSIAWKQFFFSASIITQVCGLLYLCTGCVIFCHISLKIIKLDCRSGAYFCPWIVDKHCNLIKLIFWTETLRAGKDQRECFIQPSGQCRKSPQHILNKWFFEPNDFNHWVWVVKNTQVFCCKAISLTTLSYCSHRWNYEHHVTQSCGWVVLSVIEVNMQQFKNTVLAEIRHIFGDWARERRVSLGHMVCK